MKNTLKNVMLLLLTVALLLSLPTLSVIAAEEAETGITFTNLGSYPMKKSLDALPLTLETEVLLSADHKGAAGVIFSNRNADGKTPYVDFSVEKNGNPTIKYMDVKGVAYSYRFRDVNICTGEWVHLSLVIDSGAGEVRCFVDGALKATLREDASGKEFSDCHGNAADEAFFVGGDATAKNPNYFLGAMRSMAIFDSVRTASEIASDAESGADEKSAALLCKYDMRGISASDDLTDLSGNKNHADCTLEWFGADVGAYTGEYDFSLAVVGDTQMLTFNAARNDGKYLNTFKGMYQWIIDNKEAKKIQYVIGLGDITEKGEDWGHKNNDTEAETAVGDKEWELARSIISMMDDEIPYSLVRGMGHDGLTRFNQWFAEHEGYTKNITGRFKENRVDNVYHTFRVGDVDYMNVCLDFGAKDDVLAWANEVVAAHPNHRVIVSTHAYLNTDGTTLDHGEDYAPSASYYDPENNDGNAIWKKFVSKHENIFLVLSGHMTVDDIVMNQREGEKGNTVTEMLIDPQGIDREYTGGTGMVAMLYFSGDDVFVEYYSTGHDMYKPLMSFDVNHKHAYEETVVPPVCGQHGYTRYECSCGLGYNKNPVPALSHEYDDDTDADCNLCGEVRRVTVVQSESQSSSVTEEPTLPESTSESESLAETEQADETGTVIYGGGTPVRMIVIVACCVGGAVILIALALFIKRKLR